MDDSLISLRKKKNDFHPGAIKEEIIRLKLSKRKEKLFQSLMNDRLRREALQDIDEDVTMPQIIQENDLTKKLRMMEIYFSQEDSLGKLQETEADFIQWEIQNDFCDILANADNSFSTPLQESVLNVLCLIFTEDSFLVDSFLDTETLSKFALGLKKVLFLKNKDYNLLSYYIAVLINVLNNDKTCVKIICNNINLKEILTVAITNIVNNESFIDDKVEMGINILMLLRNLFFNIQPEDQENFSFVVEMVVQILKLALEASNETLVSTAMQTISFMDNTIGIVNQNLLDLMEKILEIKNYKELCYVDILQTYCNIIEKYSEIQLTQSPIHIINPAILTAAFETLEDWEKETINEDNKYHYVFSFRVISAVISLYNGENLPFEEKITKSMRTGINMFRSLEMSAKYSSIKLEILHYFIKALEIGNKELCSNILGIKIVDILSEEISKNYPPNILSEILYLIHAALNFAKCDKKMLKENQEKLIRNGFVEQVENMMITYTNEEVRSEAEEIMAEYFTKEREGDEF